MTMVMSVMLEFACSQQFFSYSKLFPTSFSYWNLPIDDNKRVNSPFFAGLIPNVMTLKLFLDVVPSSSADNATV